MKNLKRMMCLVLVVLMALTCLVACKKKGGSAEEDLKKTEEEFNKLTTNVDKFTYGGTYSDKQKDAVMSFIEIPDLKAFTESFAKPGTEDIIDISLDKFELNGGDMLTTLGGPIAMKLNTIYGEGNSKADATVSIGGMSVGVNVYSLSDAFILSAPLFLEKPIYFDIKAMQAANREENVQESAAMNAIAELLGSDIANKLDKVFTKENCEYIMKLLKDCIPEEAITVENVKLDGFKAGYVSSIDTECYTLTVTGDVMVKIIKNALTALKSDAKIKGMFVEIFNALKETGVLDMLVVDSASLGDAEALYDNFISKGEMLVAEEYNPEEMAEVGFTVKRYFNKGVAVKTSIILSEAVTAGGAELSFWNMYVDSKNENGLLVTVSDETMLEAYCGADKNTTSGKLNINAEEIKITASYTKDNVDTSINAEVVYGGVTMAKLLVENNNSKERSVTNFDLSLDDDEDPTTDMVIYTLDIETVKGAKNETSVRFNAPELLNVEFKITSESGKKTDKKVEVPSADDCEKIDSAEALEALLGGMFGGDEDLDNDYDDYEVVESEEADL